MAAAVFGEIWATLVRRLISLLIRSSGLFDQILRQCSAGNAVNANTSVFASRNRAAALGNCGSNMAAQASPACARSEPVGCTNTVRRAAATTSWLAFGTLANTFRAKCTRHRCHDAPWK